MPIFQIIASEVPEQCLPGTYQEFINRLARDLTVSIPSQYTSIITSTVTPGPDDQDKIWFNPDDGRLRYYTNGDWELIGGAFFVGMIVAYAGAADGLDPGWHVCLGTEGTVDLRNRFILGGETSEIGLTGGSTTITLPVHQHVVGPISVATIQNGTGVPFQVNNQVNDFQTATATLGLDNYWQPYYKLAYIQYTGEE